MPGELDLNHANLDDENIPIAYAVALPKFIAMSLSTLGVYWLFWSFRAYRNLGLSKAASGVYAFFLTISLYELLKRVEFAAKRANLSVSMSKIPLALTFFVLETANRFLDKDGKWPFWLTLLLASLPVLPMIMVQRRINAVNAALRPNLPLVSRLNGLNIAWLSIFTIVICLCLVGSMLPQEPTP
ncbi:MAG TPA: hypothetical protein PKH78_08220 [Candidatus Obscuribacter sp.]|nr:hypothetical protein [Candidatus Obscuribacter sp.]HNN63011.1 hypothetical protein [Candidatus Obscuribacter sp.]